MVGSMAGSAARAAGTAAGWTATTTGTALATAVSKSGSEAGRPQDEGSEGRRIPAAFQWLGIPSERRENCAPLLDIDNSLCYMSGLAKAFPGQRLRAHSSVGRAADS